MKALYPSVALIPGTHLSPAQIRPVHQHRKGFCSQWKLAANPLSRLRPRKGSFLQPLAQHPKPASIKIQDLEPSATPVAKSKKRSAFDLLIKRRAHQRRKSLKPLSHVAGLHRYEHPQASRKTQHPRPNPIARRTSAANPACPTLPTSMRTS